MIDDLGGSDHTSELSDAQHKRVVDECYQCKLCYVICPYTPDQQQEWRIDFPQLMLRSLIANQTTRRQKSTSARLLARTDLQGKVATTLAPLVNATDASRSPRASLMEKVTGHLARAAAADVRATSGSRSGSAAATARRRRAARGHGRAVPDVPRRVPGARRSARRWSACSSTTASRASCPTGQVCCGMPWLDAGDAERVPRRTRSATSRRCCPRWRPGCSIVVPQPTCAYTIKDEYPAFLGTDAARKVAADDVRRVGVPRWPSTARRSSTPTSRAQTYESILWHSACHYRAQQIGPKSRDLMALTGAKVHDGRAVLGDRRHVGAAGRERRAGEARRQAADGKSARVGRRAGRRRLPARQRRDRRGHAASGRSIRCRCSPGPTGSRRSDVRKLTVDDIVDMRAYERERDEFRRRIIELKRTPPRRARADPDDRVREHRHDALAGAGDGARRAHAARRADRARGRDLQPAHPRRRASSRARCCSSSPPTPQLREWLPKLVGIEHHIGFVLPDGSDASRRAVRRGRGAPHPRRHDRGRALPASSRSRPSRSTRSRAGPVRLVVDHPEYRARGRARRRAARGSSLATSRDLT